MDGHELAVYALLGLALLGSGSAHARITRAMKATPPRPDRRRMTKSEIMALAEMVGFPDSNLAAAIALAESNAPATHPPTGNPEAIGDGGLSFGLWQIYTRVHPEYSQAELFDPLKNAKAAFKISEGGKNWRPWSTYRHGQYKAFL